MEHAPVPLHPRQVLVIMPQVLLALVLQRAILGEDAPDVHRRRSVGAVACKRDGQGVPRGVGDEFADQGGGFEDVVGGGFK